MLEKLKQKPESHRHKVALGTSFLVTLLIAGVWAGQKGFFGFSEETVVTKNQVEVVDKNPVAKNQKENSPLANTKNAFSAAFSEINVKYSEIKESMSSVIVPFMTGIDVYDKSEK